MSNKSSLLLTTLLFVAADALGEPPVAINGVELSAQDVASLEQRLGYRVVPGNYLYDQTSGCWTNLTQGTSGCLKGGPTTTFSRYGSGERNADGDWSYFSNITGGGVGGTQDGCVYAFGWSNC